jgi:hypothetical protein
MHRFYVATNLVSSFVAGYETETDNFYIIGQAVGNAPLISCRIHGPSGEFLFGLENNKLTPDSQGRYRQTGLGARPGWSVQDDMGKDVLIIETLEGEEAKQIVRSLEQGVGKEDEVAHRLLQEIDSDVDKVTRIYGEFYDSQGNLAARGDESGLEIHCPYILG